MFTGIMDISEEKNAPVIIAIHPDEVSHITTDLIPAMHARAHRSSVPVAIHWDHGGTYEQIITAIKAGFTSVMIDASLEPFEQNVALTRKVVEAPTPSACRSRGSSEPSARTTATESRARPRSSTPTSTTRCASSSRPGRQPRHRHRHLARALPGREEPRLRHDLLEQIKAAVGIPLVLHGGSSNPDAELARAVSLGINKINISSDIKVAYHDRMREVLGTDRRLREPNAIQPECIAAMKVTAAEKIDLFGAAGKADLY